MANNVFNIFGHSEQGTAKMPSEQPGNVNELEGLRAEPSIKEAYMYHIQNDEFGTQAVHNSMQHIDLQAPSYSQVDVQTEYSNQEEYRNAA